VLPSEAAAELDNDADHLVLRVLVVRSFVQAFQHRNTPEKERPKGMAPMFANLLEIEAEEHAAACAAVAAEREKESE